MQRESPRGSGDAFARFGRLCSNVSYGGLSRAKRSFGEVESQAELGNQAITGGYLPMASAYPLFSERPDGAAKVLSVSQLSALIEGTLEAAFQSLWVSGEVSE